MATADQGQPHPARSPRRAELLDAAYIYALEHGLADMSLRPLAAASGTSPRVLLYLFGSKDELIKEILARSRREELDLVATALAEPAGQPGGYCLLVSRLWSYLSDPRQRGTIRLFVEAYATSLRPDPGPWEGFARASITDWVGILADAQPELPRADAEAIASQTLALLRGLLLDLLARDDPAVGDSALAAACSPHPPRRSG
jgi:AcrR family transcriptional regulator